MFLAQLGITGMNVALPAIAAGFGVHAASVGAVVTVYVIASTLGLLVAGPLGDRVGRRQALLGGLAVFVAGSALAAAAPTLELLVAARAIQGAGSAVMAPMSIALVLDIFPRDRAGAMLGVLGTTSALATMLGPSLGGVILQFAGWRALPALNVPLALAIGAVVAATVAPAPSDQRSAPLFDAAVVRNGRLAAGLATSAIVSSVMISTLIVGPFVLAADGLAPSLIGFVMALGPLVSVVLAVPAGRLADRAGTRIMTISALGCFTAGALLLAAVVDRHNVGAYVAAIVVLSVGYAMFQTPNSSAVMAEASADRRATVSGLLTFSRNAGFAAGAAFLAVRFAADGASEVFGIATALGAFALAIATFGGRAGEGKIHVTT